MSSPPATRGTLGRLDLRCPPLPQTLMEAVAMLETPDTIQAAAVTQLVERDPMLLAQLLKTVNSAYYGLQRTITSPSRAVVLLGPVTVVGLVAGMSMMRLRPLVTPETQAVADRVIKHSLATGYLTRFLVEGTPGHVAQKAHPVLARSGGAFTAGLLHDLGKFVLLYNYPDEATALYRDQALDGLVEVQEAVEHERLLFGCDHTEAGTVAAHRSQFPDALVQIIRLHHSPDALRGEGVDPDVAVLLRAVVAASHAAALLGYPSDARTSDERRLDDPVWEELVRRDLSALGSADALLQRLHDEEPALHHYMGTLAPQTDGSRPRPRLRLVR